MVRKWQGSVCCNKTRNYQQSPHPGSRQEKQLQASKHIRLLACVAIDVSDNGRCRWSHYLPHMPYMNLAQQAIMDAAVALQRWPKQTQRKNHPMKAFARILPQENITPLALASSTQTNFQMSISKVIVLMTIDFYIDWLFLQCSAWSSIHNISPGQLVARQAHTFCISCVSSGISPLEMIVKEW